VTITILHGDCLAILPTLPADSFHACVTDPPYMIGFMSKAWDKTDIAARAETWAAVLRVLKPGGHMLCFGGTRTYHRVACAIEDAGFEVRDAIMYHYGSGFPKSHDVSKAIDKAAGAEREVVGQAIYGDGHVQRSNVAMGYGSVSNPANDQRNVSAPATEAARQWSGWGTALKPSTEIICVARKPLAERTVAANVLAHGCGALNIDACRVPLSENDALLDGVRHNGHALDTGKSDGAWGFKGVDRAPGLARWPANLIHDGSEEVLAAFPDTPGQSGVLKGTEPSAKTATVWGKMHRNRGDTFVPRGDAGSAARFFYTAKADAGDRLGSVHPTVKPVDLMRYLVRLVTPPGGHVLDPFAGSGTTGMAALAEGFDATLIEREAEYVADIRRRVAHVSGADTPLFAATEA
jgi:DNA modification methylase